jgi:dTDP-4-dehydrorhamnose reductase
MRLLVVGAGGLLGSNVASRAHERGWAVVGTYHTTRPDLPVDGHRLDIRDEERVEGLLRTVEPAAVVNCAAITDVDRCETDGDLARAVNARAPGTIAAACGAVGAACCHVSTDYVFDGRAEDRYAESAEPNPLQVYGETKLAGEAAVGEHHSDPLVVRPSFLYGVHRGRGELVGFPAWVRERLRAGESLSLFDDQFVTPSRADPTARAMLDLLASGRTGTYHVACRDCVTPYAMGEAVRERLDAPRELLETGSLADVDRPARRPPNTCLDVSAVADALERDCPTLAEDVDAIGDALDGDPAVASWRSRQE